MANTVTVHFLDGPCNGTSRKVTPQELTQPYLTCKDNEYLFDPADSASQRRTVYRFAGATSGGGSGSSQLSAPQALKGWKSVRRSVNVTMRTSLTDSRHSSSAALRSLARARKVRL